VDQQELNFQRITAAIDYIRLHFRSQPTLDDVAAAVNVSPFHFQRLFTEWAGISPKKFLQFTSIEYAKSLLTEKQATLFDTALETGLSGTGRLHDLFVQIEGMTPGEYRNGGQTLRIRYRYSASPFGNILVASTEKGICHLEFAPDEATAMAQLTKRFPNALLIAGENALQRSAMSLFSREWKDAEKVKLHLKGTDFQLKVWQALLQIPSGRLATYGRMAAQLGNPKAARAVGTAIGDNPVAFIIPCHRVIQSGRQPGGYHWGISRKHAIIGWESALSAPEDEL
jgi:AraC family transcriptional regulator of adaptative response/methylated-DNA-[protein]-cysteine methyltransferase